MSDNYGKTTSEVVEHNGRLLVLDPWENRFSKPIKYRTAWPTGLFAKDYQHFIGQKVRHRAGGTYLFNNGADVKSGARKQNTSQYKILRRTQPIPKSPGCHKYRNGKWSR